MKNSYTLIFLFFIIVVARGQNVQIEGVLQGVKDSTEVWFNKSVDAGYFNYLNNSDYTIAQNNFFRKSFKTKGVGAFTIASNPYMPSVMIIAEEGDKIKLIVKKENDKFALEFEGNNALGLEELNRSSLLNFKKMTPYLKSIFESASTSDDFFLKMENLRTEFMKPFEVLLKNKNITLPFYEIANKQVDLYLLFNINFLVYNFKGDPNKLKGLHLTENDLTQILIKTDHKYDGFDEKYDNCDGLIRTIAIQRKCLNISGKILEGSKKDIGLWSGSEDMYSYAPIRYQELLIANNIKHFGFDKSGCSYEKFIETFPNSPYLVKIKELNNLSKTVVPMLPYTLAFYPYNATKLKLESVFEFKGLTELIQHKFTGKPVFVDLWASYCAPCKKEFGYSKPLHSFLKANNIEILYVSVDNKSQISKWEKDILAYDLRGVHYFASSTIVTSLQKLLNVNGEISIPRYLLFNLKGELVLTNAKRPSEGQNLYDEILSALKNN